MRYFFYYFFLIFYIDLFPKKVKLVGTDIDGVWTDARMYVTPGGERMKAFSTYDGMATAMLKKKGIIIAILT